MRRATGSARAWPPLVLAIVILFSPSAHPADQLEFPSVRVGITSSPIHIDGVLDEPDWQAAGVVTDIRQQSPVPSGPMPYRTEIRLLRDGENLYIGAICFDPEPGSISIHTFRNTDDMTGDDQLTFVLDTYGDSRTGYFFRINAGAAREDGTIWGRGQSSPAWDGVWDSAARRTDEGWTAEIVLPAATLRFRDGLDVWGFNIDRYVPRDRTRMRWANPTLDGALTDFTKTGTLSGMSGLQQGRGLSFSPYVLGEVVTGPDYGRTVWSGKPGIDITYSLTTDLSAVLTGNTDFAETEVDTRQINLTRFSIFFPEKRRFFLEGSSQFEFGLELNGQFIPFYSRRVGLYRGEQVPITAGLKLVGKAGQFGVGVLDTQLRSDGEAEPANLFAGRITYDHGENWQFGAIGTNGNPDGVTSNSLVGVDAIYRTSRFRQDKNFQVGTWFARSGGDLPEGSRNGWGFKIDYPNDLWDLFLVTNQFGDALDPALGFLPRPGTRQYRTGGAWQPRPQGGAFDWARQFFFELVYERVDDLDGRNQSWEVFTAPFNVETESGWHLEANYDPQSETLAEPFEIADGIVIPAGRYRFDRYRIEAESPLALPWQVGTEVWFGGFYGGRMTQVLTWLGLTSFCGHLQQTLELENDFGDLPQGRFIQRLWQYRCTYAWNPDLVLSSYFQYDTESRGLGMNTRLVWTFKPGNDLFVVWNRDWEHPLGSDPWELSRRGDQVAVKLRLTFRT